ncbi:MAG: 1-acyl-sn-glycerol-3-phosphate acyltransferase [Bdellovibrionales bacterium]|nr:1-acyl-sn-glycerol-3-phosphate acyltransferase [Bdellovibrionales bacterium]
MKKLIQTPKNLITTNYFIGKYTLEGVVNSLVNRSDDAARRKKALLITAKNASSVLKGMNVKIRTEFEDKDIFERNYFMVANHMSYLDILILSSIRPAVFVTSKEMEKTFFLGDMAKLGGSFFVDRVNRRKIKEEVAALENLLHQGFNVFIFPEGTSTDGSQVLPFKKSLFRVPFQTQFPILPICLKYEKYNGEAFGPQNRDNICWYGDMTFGPHFLQLMGTQELEVSLKYLNPLDPKQFASHGELAQRAHQLINDCYMQRN